MGWAEEGRRGLVVMSMWRGQKGWSVLLTEGLEKFNYGISYCCSSSPFNDLKSNGKSRGTAGWELRSIGTGVLLGGGCFVWFFL